MKVVLLSVFGLLSLAACFAQPKREIDFSNNWRFVKDSTIDASSPSFDDSKWRQLDLPHDWSIEDLPNDKSPFSKSSVGQGSTGFTVGGTGWYRKKFITEKAFSDRVVSINFDGVYMNASVWLNGHLLGTHHYGYTPFNFDLTQYLNPAGKENILVVRAENKGKNSRWYAGSGIYRDVWLTVTRKTFIKPFGVQVITKDANVSKATVEVRVDINTPNGITITNTVISPAKKVVARSDGSQLQIPSPELWSIDSPKLYTLITEIKNVDNIIDRVETVFGIRTISFTADKGFQLNGKKVLLKGGCIHHDNGPLGAAVYYRAEERKVEILKQNGFNAIRTSHNPPSRELLDACDRLGMLVIDEAFDMWEKPKNPQDYHLYFKDLWQQDLDALILRDRNHPSVIIWSIGNEIKERVDESGLRIAKAMVDRVHQLDATRPVTEAMCEFWDNKGYTWDQTTAAFKLLDIGAYNYLYAQYEKDHAQFPSRVMVGTESHAMAAYENWNEVEKHPYVIGDFVWTAFDYIGEASIGNSKYEATRRTTYAAMGWPYYNGYCGDIDLIGNKKPQSYYRDVVWRNDAITMAVHPPIPDGLVENITAWGWPDEMQSWTWPGLDGKNFEVSVYSREKTIRLYLNNKIVGEKNVGPNTIAAKFDVPYRPGTLKAICFRNGKKVDSVELKTAGAPAKIRLTSDRSIIGKDKDLSFVMVDVVDKDGIIVPTAAVQIDFTVGGEGSLAGVGNGSPNDVSSFQQPTKKTWRGQCLLVIKSNGTAGSISVKATSLGLIPGEAEINSN